MLRSMLFYSHFTDDGTDIHMSNGTVAQLGKGMIYSYICLESCLEETDIS